MIENLENTVQENSKYVTKTIKTISSYHLAITIVFFSDFFLLQIHFIQKRKYKQLHPPSPGPLPPLLNSVSFRFRCLAGSWHTGMFPAVSIISPMLCLKNQFCCIVTFPCLLPPPPAPTIRSPLALQGLFSKLSLLIVRCVNNGTLSAGMCHRFVVQLRP